MKSISVIFLVCFISSFCIETVAQDMKKEREEKIKKRNLPAGAVRFAEVLDGEGVRKLKYYKETDNRSISYEVKFSFRGRSYSAEFDTSGNIEDIELTIGPSEVPKDVKHRTDSIFAARYDHYKIRKVQKQYSCREQPDCTERIIRLVTNDDAEDLNVRYEYEIDGTEGRKLVSHELLFGADGTLLAQRVISRRQTDNVFY